MIHWWRGQWTAVRVSDDHTLQLLDSSKSSRAVHYLLKGITNIVGMPVCCRQCVTARLPAEGPRVALASCMNVGQHVLTSMNSAHHSVRLSWWRRHDSCHSPTAQHFEFVSVLGLRQCACMKCASMVLLMPCICVILAEIMKNGVAKTALNLTVFGHRFAEISFNELWVFWPTR